MQIPVILQNPNAIVLILLLGAVISGAARGGIRMASPVFSIVIARIFYPLAASFLESKVIGAALTQQLSKIFMTHIGAGGELPPVLQAALQSVDISSAVNTLAEKLSGNIINITSFYILFIASDIILRSVANSIANRIMVIGLLNHAAGAIFGLVVGVALLSGLYLIMTFMAPYSEVAELVVSYADTSTIMAIIKNTSDWLFKAITNTIAEGVLQ